MKNAECIMQNEFGAKGYTSPRLEFIELEADDIITTSTGTETPLYEENDGIWDLDIGVQ